MSYEKINFTIKGIMPTIQHNGHTSDPLNKFSKEMKKISSKRKKTDEDHLKLAKIEWYASLYVDEHQVPCWPGENIETMIVSAAKKHRMGNQTKLSIFVDGNVPIMHDGPKSADAIWNYKSFDNNPYIFRTPVTVNRGKIMRTRPIFRDWSMEFDVHYLPDLVTEEQVVDFVETAGKMIGLSDNRPKYGRFIVESVKGQK